MCVPASSTSKLCNSCSGWPWQDEKIDRFLGLCRMAQEQKLPPRKTEAQFENELKHSLGDLIRAKGENLVQFLSLILDKLIQLMIRPPTISGQMGKYMCAMSCTV